MINLDRAPHDYRLGYWDATAHRAPHSSAKSSRLKGSCDMRRHGKSHAVHLRIMQCLSIAARKGVYCAHEHAWYQHLYATGCIRRNFGTTGFPMDGS